MKKSILGLVSISFFGGLIGRGLRYGGNVIVARGLGTEAFGAFVFGMVVMKFVGVIAKGGFDDAAQKFVPEFNQSNEQSRLTGLAILCLGGSLTIGALLSLCSYFLVDTFVAPGNRGIVRLFLVGSPIFAFLLVGMSLSKGFRETRYAVIVREIFQSGIALTLISVGSFLLNDLTSTVVGYLVSLTMGCLLLLYFLHKQGGIAFVEPALDPRPVLSFAASTSLISVVQYLIPWTSVLLLGSLATDLAVGRYQAAFQTAALLPVILHAANSLFPSIVSDLESKGDDEGIRRIYSSLTKWIATLTVIGFAFVVLNADGLLAIFEVDTPRTETILVALALSQTVAAVTGPVGYLIMMTGNERLDTANVTALGALNIGINYVLIQSHGMLGAAVATAVSIALLNLVRLVEIRFLLGYFPYSKSYLRTGLIVPVTVLGIWTVTLFGLEPIPRLFFSAAVALIFFVSAVAVIGLADEDRILFGAIK